jgi:hypothetical protein
MTLLLVPVLYRLFAPRLPMLETQQLTGASDARSE